MRLRKYGLSPFRISVVHGGPGAPGQLVHLAKELSTQFGVLEPFQTKYTFNEQTQELGEIIEENGEVPHIVIGHSYGAILSLSLAVKFPYLVKKLILVGSAVLDEKYAKNIDVDRKKRLSQKEMEELNFLMNKIAMRNQQSRSRLIKRIDELFIKSDSYKPNTLDSGLLDVQIKINQKVWSEVKDLRTSGRLLEMVKQVTCPVYVVHGANDPHPSAGVISPLRSVLKTFKYTTIPHCGHYPWLEKESKSFFFQTLYEYINDVQ